MFQGDMTESTASLFKKARRQFRANRSSNTDRETISDLWDFGEHPDSSNAVMTKCPEYDSKAVNRGRLQSESKMLGSAEFRKESKNAG